MSLANLKLALRPWWYRASLLAKRQAIRQHVGANTYIDPTVHVLRWRNVRIGSGTIVAQGTTINVNDHQSDRIQIDIGNHCFIGQRNFFSPGHGITVGDFTMTALDAKFICSGHRIDDPNVPYKDAGVLTTHDIRIGVNCWIATSAMVFGHVNIGHGCVIGANSVVRNDIPPFAIAVGNPARITKRYSFLQQQWIAADAWTDTEAQHLPSESDYLQHLLSTADLRAIAWRAAGKSMGDSW